MFCSFMLYLCAKVVRRCVSCIHFHCCHILKNKKVSITLVKVLQSSKAISSRVSHLQGLKYSINGQFVLQAGKLLEVNDIRLSYNFILECLTYILDCSNASGSYRGLA